MDRIRRFLVGWRRIFIRPHTQTINFRPPLLSSSQEHSNLPWPLVQESGLWSRILEERQERRPPLSAPDRMRKAGQMAAHPTANGSMHAHVDQRNPPPTHSPEHDTVPAPAAAVAEKLNLDLFEWPRIYVSLSRKEKEDDFLAMKGTKLPQRPKKRAKNIDKSLQYCFPGMWLSDLTKGRYEVREKKCVKKKRRGLKGMESMDSDSD